MEILGQSSRPKIEFNKVLKLSGFFFLCFLLLSFSRASADSLSPDSELRGSIPASGSLRLGSTDRAQSGGNLRADLYCAHNIGLISHYGVSALQRLQDINPALPSGRPSVLFSGRFEGQQGVFIFSENFQEFASLSGIRVNTYREEHSSTTESYGRMALYDTPVGVGEDRTLTIAISHEAPAAPPEDWLVYGWMRPRFEHFPSLDTVEGIPVDADLTRSQLISAIRSAVRSVPEFLSWNQNRIREEESLHVANYIDSGVSPENIPAFDRAHVAQYELNLELFPMALQEAVCSCSHISELDEEFERLRGLESLEMYANRISCGGSGV